MMARVYSATVWTLAVVAAAGAPLAAQPEADEAAVGAVVSRFHNAVTSGDAAGAMTIVADDALFLEAGGVETRSEYEKNHLPGDIEFEKSVGVKRSALRVVVAGDAAWTTCTSEFKGTFQGRTIDSIGTELMVLSRRAGGWQIRAVHWSSRARPAK
jgi:ketosteroid isomerase-like protein